MSLTTCQSPKRSKSADLTERQSLRWMWNETEYDGGYLADVPVGGYRRLLAPLTDGLAIQLGFEVEEIAVIDGAVRVTGTDGRVEFGSHVVVTVPLGVLKDGRPRFVPPLPEPRRNAIARLGYGHFEKDRARLRRALLANGQAAADHAPTARPGRRRNLAVRPRRIDLGESTSPRSLTALIPHSAAHHVLDCPSDEAVAWILGLLSQAIGRACPAPLASAVTSWETTATAEGSTATSRPAPARPTCRCSDNPFTDAYFSPANTRKVTTSSAPTEPTRSINRTVDPSSSTRVHDAAGRVRVRTRGYAPFRQASQAVHPCVVPSLRASSPPHETRYSTDGRRDPRIRRRGRRRTCSRPDATRWRRR
jgi:Flavin containing amine oxidoreductase